MQLVQHVSCTNRNFNGMVCFRAEDVPELVENFEATADK